MYQVKPGTPAGVSYSRVGSMAFSWQTKDPVAAKVTCGAIVDPGLIQDFSTCFSHLLGCKEVELNPDTMRAK